MVPKHERFCKGHVVCLNDRSQNGEHYIRRDIFQQRHGMQGGTPKVAAPRETPAI